MAQKHSAPPPPDAIDEAVAGGHFDGTWFFEEHPEATRLAFRVTRRLHEEASPYQKITVYDTPFFGRLLAIDDLVMLTQRDEFVYHEMLTHVPLCSLVDPKTVLIIGGGDCGCLREVLRHPGIERAVLCEIDERVTRVCEAWFDWVTPALADPRAEVLFEDGAAFMRNQTGVFDLIIIDSTDPVGPAIPLFMADFYRQAARALKPTGVLTAQTESPAWTPQLVGSIFHQQRQAFAHVAPYVGFIPTYQSGMWSWSYASHEPGPPDVSDGDRAAAIARTTRYYNPAIHRAAFALPTFARRACDGEDPFASFDRRARPLRDLTSSLGTD